MELREKRSKKAIRATLKAIDGASGGRPLALALSEAMRDEGDLGPQERRAAARAARGVLRELRRIDSALSLTYEAVGLKLKTLLPEDRSLLRYLALRVSIEQEAPDRSLRELALPGPRRPRVVHDQQLAQVAQHLPPADRLPLPSDPLRALALRRSVPDFVARMMIDDLGADRADAVLAALNQEPRLDLRANRLLASRDELAARLTEEKVQLRPCPLSPDGLIAEDRAHLFGRTHAHGLFEVQDEGSQLLALLCGAQPGERVIDFCAGSGGKSLALAAAVAPGGKVFACDAVARRLAELPQRARRARAQRLIEVAGAEPPAELLSSADAVLVDAPCSGLGSLRREVDLRWRLKEEAIQALPAQQLGILERAADFVRPGGRLIYGTCSPLRMENEAVVEAFLRPHPAFSLASAADFLPAQSREALSEDRRFLRLWPDRHDTGAFFGAVILRDSA